ncbi:hypothetical protein ABVT39_007238 [Epinephelus coioides]
MWVLSVAHQHKLLLVGTRRLHKSALFLRVGCYHVSASVLHPEDSSINPVVRRRHSVINTSGVQHKPVVPDGRRDHKRSVQSKVRKNETPVLQKPSERRGGDSRVSSELRRLSLEDFPEQKERMEGQRSTLDSKAESYEVCEEAHRQGVQVQRVSKRDLDKMSSGRVHQGVCLQASPLSYLTEDRDSAPSRGDTPLWLVLERIQDPMNLGAILRSAYFLGVDRVVSSLRHSCPLSPVVSKASSGVMEVLEVYGYEDLEDMLELKVAQGWQVVGTVGAEAQESQIPVTQCADFHMTKPTVLLMGGEGEGLSQQLLSLCQTLLTIPAGRELFPGIESLNVSVATGILLHSLLSSRSSTT